jgi:hypothetical protein
MQWFQAPDHAAHRQQQPANAVKGSTLMIHFVTLVQPATLHLALHFALPAAPYRKHTSLFLHRTCCTAASLPLVPRSFSVTATTLTTSSPAAAAGTTGLPGVLGPSATMAAAADGAAVTVMVSGAAAARSSAEGGGGATGCLGAPCMPRTASSASHIAACV